MKSVLILELIGSVVIVLSVAVAYRYGQISGMLRAIELTRKWKQEDAIIVVREDEALNSAEGGA